MGSVVTDKVSLRTLSVCTGGQGTLPRVHVVGDMEGTFSGIFTGAKLAPS
jgi:hypothetical protein